MHEGAGQEKRAHADLALIESRALTDWIFIRGLVREAAHWGDFAHDFAAAFPEARVHFLDLPGNGDTNLEKTPLTVAAMTDEIRSEARLKCSSKPSLLGLSLGGMVACDWAQRFANELSAIVLVNTSFGGYSPPHHRLRAAAVRTLLGALGERDLVRKERAHLAITSNRPEVHDAIAARWAGVARARPVSQENAVRQLLAAARFRPAREAPSVPHLILCGAGDKLVQPACSRIIAETWNAPLHEHPTAGHDLSLDAGDWMISEIRDWLAVATHGQPL